MLSPSCLFNGYMGSCDKNFLSKTTSSPHFLTYVISSRVASDYLVYSLILLHLLLTLKKIRQYSKVGNALQKGINHQNYNDSVFVSRTSERALLLVQMQCIFFFCTGTCRMTGFCRTQCHREPFVFLEKTGTRHRLCNSSPILNSLITIISCILRLQISKKKRKNKLLCSES